MPKSFSLPCLVCRKAPVKIQVDTLAGSRWWHAAEQYSLNALRKSLSDIPTKARFSTTVRCFWDETSLYVAFRCECPDVWATKTQRDSELWNEPVVEVFLDVTGEGKSFFEFQVNPLGTIYDSFVSDVGLKDDWRRWSRWNCESLKIDVKIEGKLNERTHRDVGWCAVFAIPFADIVKQAGSVPKAGDAWRANFCRYDYSAELPEPELSCWSPVVKAFDDLKNFGTIIFVE